jgi:hypothetical protein
MAVGGALEPHVPAGALTEVNLASGADPLCFSRLGFLPTHRANGSEPRLASVERPGEALPSAGVGRFAQ